MILSIITVNKNSGESFLKTKENLIPILHDLKEIEWIIVDAESSDSSAKEIIDIKNNYHFKNIKIIIEKDEGIYFAMNKGIHISNSKFILFINSGDTINKNILYSFIRSDPEINQSFIYGYKVEGEKQSFLYYIKNILKALENKLKLVLPSSHNAIIYSSEAIKKDNFNCKYHFGADFNQYYSLQKKNHVFINKYNLKLTNLNNKGYISRNKEMSYKNYMDILKNYSYKFGYFYWTIRLRLLRLKKFKFINK